MRNADSVGHMSMWWEYVTAKSQSETAPPIARKMGIDQSTVNRWRTSTPRPEQVVTFAKAYGRPVLEAFIAAGFITPEDANQAPAAEPDPGRLSNEALSEEVRRRLTRVGASERQPHFEKDGSEVSLEPPESVGGQPYTPDIITGRGRRRTTAQPKKSGQDGVSTKGSEGTGRT